jgi:hypothetical protein
MPKIKHWRTDPDEELARLISTNEMTDFWTSNIDIVVGPGESAVIIKDGSIEEVLTQQRIENLAGGFNNWLGEKLRTKEQFDILIVDNKPFQVELGVDGLTSDDVAQSGIAKVTLRLNHENANRIIGVLREKAIKVKKGFFRKKTVTEGYETVLTRTTIEQMLAEEARAKVFRILIRKYEAKDLGGSKAIDQEVATSAKTELHKTLETWGMSIENIFVDWSPNAYQSWKAQRAPTTWIKKAKQEEQETDEIRDLEFSKRKKSREREVSTIERDWAEEDTQKSLELSKRSKLREREASTMERDWADEDAQKSLEGRRKRLELEKQIALEETKLETELEDLKGSSASSQKIRHARTEAEVQTIQSGSDKTELEKLVGLKEQMLQQKMTRKGQEQAHELEMTRIKADVDKTVGVADADARAKQADAKAKQADVKLSENSKKKRENNFLVEAVYLVYNDGRLLAHVLSEDQKTDPEILTSMLIAVGDFVSDSLGTKGHLGTMQHGDSTILIEQGKECHLAAVTYGKPGEGLKKELRKQLSSIEDKYIKDLKGWEGDVSLFAGCTTNLVKVVLQSTAKSRSEVD